MSTFITQLHEKRNRAWEGAKEILDRAAAEKRDLTAEEDAAYLRANEEIDALDQRINGMLEAQRKAKEAEDTFAELTRTAPTGPTGEERRGGDKNAELRAWLKGETGKRGFEVRPDGPVNYRATMQKTATHGLETVPTSFYNRLIEHMIEVSGVLMAGPTVLTTAGGEDLQIPKTTAHSSSASIVAEATALSQNEPTFGQVTLGSFKYGFLMKLSHELLNDTAVDLEGYLSRQAGRALGNGFGAHLVTGTGSSQPNGVLTAATLGKTGATTGASGAPTADELIDLQYSVIAPYRNSPSCGWLMKDSTVGTVRKLKDANGVYVWQPGLLAGSPDMLLGKPLHTDPNMPALATSAKAILFGDFQAYFVRHVETIRFERSDDFAFDTDVVTYRAILRGDGDLVDTTGALKFYQGAAS